MPLDPPAKNATLPPEADASPAPPPEAPDLPEFADAPRPATPTHPATGRAAHQWAVYSDLVRGFADGRAHIDGVSWASELSKAFADVLTEAAKGGDAKDLRAALDELSAVVDDWYGAASE